MSADPNIPPRSRLRATYERSRVLPQEAQLQECVDLLGHPEILVDEFVEAFCEGDARGAVAARREEGEGELVLEYFYEGRDIVVHGGVDTHFRCLASGFDPLPPVDPSERDGLDYVAIGRDPSPPFPALGAVQSERDATPYLVLLRLLACASELAPRVQLERLDRELFDGKLGAEPAFDLHLVLWDAPAAAASVPLFELTRDLAEVVKASAAQDSLFPPVLGEVSAYHMDPDQFEGQLTLAWQV